MDLAYRLYHTFAFFRFLSVEYLGKYNPLALEWTLAFMGQESLGRC